MSAVEESLLQPPARDQQLRALEYARNELKGHRRAERTHQVLFFVFQGLTVVAAAAATVVAVADPNDVSAEVRAIPAAFATLGASVLAAFQFRGGWRRHVTAARELAYEILKFENEVREYRRSEPRPEASGVDLFLDRVHAISHAGHQEPDAVAADARTEESAGYPGATIQPD